METLNIKYKQSKVIFNANYIFISDNKWNLLNAYFQNSRTTFKQNYFLRKWHTYYQPQKSNNLSIRSVQSGYIIVRTMYDFFWYLFSICRHSDQSKRTNSGKRQSTCRFVRGRNWFEGVAHNLHRIGGRWMRRATEVFRLYATGSNWKTLDTTRFAWGDDNWHDHKLRPSLLAMMT